MNKVWLILGLVLGAVMLTVAARQVDVAQMFSVLRDIDLRYVALAVLGSLAFLFVKAWRWALLLSPLKQTRMMALTPAVCIGTAANLVVPHAGEFARVLMVGDRETLPTSALLASVVIERLFDFAAVLAFLGIIVLARTPLPDALISASVVAGSLFVLLLLMSAFAVFRSRQALGLVRMFTGWLPARIKDALNKQAEIGIDGLAALRHAHVLAKVSLVSLLQWATIVVVIYASVLAVGVQIPLAGAVCVLALMVAGLTLPAAPVYIGTTQLAFSFGLAGFGVASAHAVAASVVYTLFGLLPELAAGGFCLLLTRGGNRPAMRLV